MLKFADVTRRGRSQTSLDNRRGFALPTVLVLMMVLSTITALLLSSSSDAQRSGRAIRESALSFYAADAGLNEVLSDWESQSYADDAPNPGDSFDLGWDTLQNGTRFRAVFTRVDGGSAGGVVHSIRIVGQGDGPFAGSTTIFREIGASWGGAAVTLFDAGNSAVEGGSDNGTADFQSGTTVSGFDTNPPGWAAEGICDPLEDKPGIIWEDLSNVVGESAGELMGDPQQVEDASLTTPDLLDFGGLDFDELAAMANYSTNSSNWGPSLGPVVTGGVCDTSVSSNWGAPMDPSSPCFDYFPIIHFTRNGVQRFSGCGDGQGIILVENGNMEMEGLCGTFNFYGIIITKLNGGGSGLEIADTDFNMLGAIIVTTSTELDGGDITYSQCVVARALAANGMGATVGGGGSATERAWRQATN